MRLLNTVERIWSSEEEERQRGGHVLAVSRCTAVAPQLSTSQDRRSNRPRPLP